MDNLETMERFIRAPSRNAASYILPRVILLIALSSHSDAFVHPPSEAVSASLDRRRCSTFLNLQAPPGSGYFSEVDEVSFLPDSYDPMMEYPGTMRPGRTPENVPFQDLPIGDDDPDPVPWPHFQQIEWHHRWDPPHEHPTPMELFIEQNGRWAAPELEAEMRAGVRRGMREKKEAEEAERRGTIITDDDDDEIFDDEMTVNEDPVSLGDGVFGQLGSAADQAATAAAVDPNKKPDAVLDDDDDDEEDVLGTSEEEEEDDDGEGDGGLDDFLFDLGLDSELDLDDDSKEKKEEAPKTVAKSLRDLENDDDDDEDVGPPSTQTIHVEEDDDDFDIDDEDDLDGDSSGGSVPLDDFGGNEDSLDDVDIFDEGGFDFDDDFGGDGGDVW